MMKLLEMKQNKKLKKIWQFESDERSIVQGIKDITKKTKKQ